MRKKVRTQNVKFIAPSALLTTVLLLVPGARAWAQIGIGWKQVTNWVHVNVIHDRDQHLTQVYIGRQLKGQWNDTDSAANYFKYGCYGTMRTGSAKVQWKNVKFFVKD